jgi:tetratricopeptide (TPR) repeat protein
LGAYHTIAVLVLSAGGPLDEDPAFRAAQELYAQRDNLLTHERAADAFAAIARRMPDNPEAQIWCARTAYYASHRMVDDKPRMRRVADVGYECGGRLLGSLNPSYPAQIWGLLSIFRKATAAPGLPPLGEIEKLTVQLEALRAKVPNEYMAYMLLTAVYRELPRWPFSIGDRKKALAMAAEASELAPNNAEVLLELAATYRADGDTAKAKATYKRCIEHGELPAELSWEAADARAWAKKMLAELE